MGRGRAALISLRTVATFEAPVRVVWTDLADLRGHSEWMRDAAEVFVDGPDPIGIGTKFQAATSVGPVRLRDRMEVTEWEPGRTMAVRHLGPVIGSGRFTLESASPDRTRIVWEERLRFPWWLAGPLGEQVAAPILRRLFRANLDAFAARYR